MNVFSEIESYGRRLCNIGEGTGDPMKRTIFAQEFNLNLIIHFPQNSLNLGSDNKNCYINAPQTLRSTIEPKRAKARPRHHKLPA